MVDIVLQTRIPAALSVLANVVLSLRPKHWIKNLFIFAPLLFSGHFRNAPDVYATIWGFVIFSLAASSIYLLNDIIDRERDAASPTNRDRPVASGKVSVTSAAVAGIVLQVSSLYFAYLLKTEFFVLVSLYAVNNVLYSLYLKQKVIVDVISISVGFVLRVLAGAAVISVVASHWLIVCTFSISILLGFGKRRAELLLAPELRTVNEIYTPAKLDHMISVSAGITLFSYMMYAVAPETTERFGGAGVIYTVPFVLYGVFRYVAKIQEGKCKDPVQLIYTDHVFVANLILWLVAILALLVRAYPVKFAF